jgi:hypothetical protein
VVQSCKVVSWGQEKSRAQEQGRRYYLEVHEAREQENSEESRAVVRSCLKNFVKELDEKDRKGRREGG